MNTTTNQGDTTMNTTTDKLTTVHSSNIADYLQVTQLDGGYTITFDDLDQALAAVEKAKNASWQQYLKSGGNPRNKRSHGTQYAAIKKALIKAAA
jgi:hypothetical protein